MTEPKNKMTGLYLGDEDARLTEIADAMTRDLGITVSRSEAARRIIRWFRLSLSPVSRIDNAATDEQIAA